MFSDAAGAEIPRPPSGQEWPGLPEATNPIKNHRVFPPMVIVKDDYRRADGGNNTFPAIPIMNRLEWYIGHVPTVHHRHVNFINTLYSLDSNA